MKRIYEVRNGANYENVVIPARMAGLAITEKDWKTKIILEGDAKQFKEFDRIVNIG